ncbi:vWA domain-containing protein [Halobellus inordinatus]|uniref:vWA domain-containing protein n=1 Tax=Halobellus inordinatus TaxID=1126236 RepID=UPI0021094DAD|nr:VWA domain-containing protein [Halobellus inordinatus]
MVALGALVPTAILLDPATATLLELSVELIEGLSVGLARPAYLLAFPIAALTLWALVFRDASGTASEDSRRWFLAARLAVVALVVLSAAGPYTTQSKLTTGEPRVTMLVDQSDSMAVTPNVENRLAESIESAGVSVRQVPVGAADSSPVGDAVAANIRENGSLVLLSDGRVTSGQSLQQAAELARSANATVSTVSMEPRTRERYVTIEGPEKASLGVQNRFVARVDGVGGNTTATLTVSVDGEQVLERAVNDVPAPVVFNHTFESTGSHTVTAEIDVTDRFVENDVSRKTVRVVERPEILYVSPGEYPFRDYLDRLYDVETAERVPEDLSPYYAVVVQDTPADEIGNVDRLQEFVIDGGGLLVVGGTNSFESGGYRGSNLASMLPVSVGEGEPRSTNIVLSVDVSGSAQEGMRIQKATALSVLDQLGDENEVGLVGFNYQAYRVSEVEPLSQNRQELQDKIRRLRAGGATDIAAGVDGGGELLGDRVGTVILISDGHDNPDEAASVARQLSERGIQVVTVGAGETINERTLRTIAGAGGGSYFRATETTRLGILFGGTGAPGGSGLIVIDRGTFITSGVTLTADPDAFNDVSVRRGADFLVAGDTGQPALATWRYGLGRVATITAHDDDGTLGGLLREPDSLLVTRTTNYAIGDPERKATGVTGIPDTRVGEPTTVTYRGADRPAVDGIAFRRVGEETFQATVTPDSTGYFQILDATYAADYAREYAAFGPDPALESLAEDTGGREFTAGQGEQIARFATERARGIRPVRTDWTWLPLLLGLLVFTAEVSYRRLQVRRRDTTSDGGLP